MVIVRRSYLQVGKIDVDQCNYGFLVEVATRIMRSCLTNDCLTLQWSEWTYTGIVSGITVSFVMLQQAERASKMSARLD